MLKTKNLSQPTGHCRWAAETEGPKFYFGRSRALGYSWLRRFLLVSVCRVYNLRRLFVSGIYSTSPNPTAAYLTSQHMHGYGTQQPLQPQQHQQQAGHRST